MRIVAILIIWFLAVGSASGQMKQAWLDSISKPDYIVREYQLEEVVVNEKAKLLDRSHEFYRQHALSSTDDVLENLEGVWMIKRGNYAAEPVMRGLSGGQINVTIDGMRILGACTDKMDPVTSYIEPNNLDKIEVSQGAAGSSSGSTTGGSMNFNLKKPGFNREQAFSGKFSSRYASAARAIEKLGHLNFSREKWAVNGGFTYRQGQDYRAGGGETIPFSAYHKINYSTSVSWLPKENQLLNISFIGDDGWDIGYPALPMDVAYAKAKILGLQYDWWNKSPFFDHIQLKAYANSVRHAMDDSQREVLMRMDMPGYTQTQGGYVLFGLPEAGAIRGNLKLDGYRSLAHAEMTMYSPNSPPMFMLTWPDITRKVVAANGDFTLDLTNRFSLAADLRLERNHAQMKSRLGENQFRVFGYEGEAAADWLINSGVSLIYKAEKVWESSLQLSYGERMPNEGEQFGFYLFNIYDGFDYLGNPYLRKEKSLQLEAMVGATTEHLAWKLNVFGYRFYDYIFSAVNRELSSMTLGANGVKEYRNILNAGLFGAENTLMYSAGHFTALAIAKYVYGVGEEGNPLPLIPPFKLNLSARYHFPFNVGIRVESESAAKQDRINPHFGENSTSGYHIINAGLDYKLGLPNENSLKFSAGVENMFDKEYQEHLDWGNIPRPGRNVSVGLSYQF